MEKLNFQLLASWRSSSRTSSWKILDGVRNLSSGGCCWSFAGDPHVASVMSWDDHAHEADCSGGVAVLALPTWIDAMD